MIKSISAITKYKNGISKLKATDKLSIKSIILPDVHESDDSTINFTKRVGGEMIQCYSLSEVKLKQPDICVPTFKEVIFTPCRASSIWVDIPCEPSIFDFEVEIPVDSDFSFTTRNTTIIPEYDYETGTYIPGEFPTTPLTLSLTLKDIEGFWSLKRNNELLYSSEQMPPLDTNREIYEGGDFDYDIKFSLDIGEGSVGAVNVYEFKGKVSELGILTRNNAVATGELEITRYDSINISKYKFTTINVDLILPDYFPNHITTAKHMFFNSSIKGSSLSSWDVSNVMNMSGMFSEVNFKNNVDLSSWVTTKVKDMSYMFEGAFNFNQNISGWDVSNVTNMEYMFSSAVAFNQDLSSWDVVNIPTEPSSFATNATQWVLPKPWDKEVSVILPETQPLHFNIVSEPTGNGADSFGVSAEGISGDWYVLVNDNIVAGSNIDRVNGFDASIYEDTLNITINDLAATTTDVKIYCNSVSVRLYNSARPADPVGRHVNVLSFSDTITDYLFEFKHCTATVPQTLPSHITSLSDMFAGSTMFNQDLSGWDTSKVTEMSRTFQGCELFNGDITTWDTSNVTNMGSMFNRAKSFNQDIGGWNVGKVEGMLYMFGQASKFNQDLSNWCVNLITSKPFSFDDLASVWTLPKPVWGTCPPPPTHMPEYTPFEFNVTSSGGAVFALETSGNPTEWMLYQDDVLITTEETRTNHRVSDLKEGVTNFKLFTDGASINMREGSAGTNTTIDFLSFCEAVPRTIFSIQSYNFTVPKTLPANHTDLRDMFKGCNAFNQDLSEWDTSRVTDMSQMFYETDVFNGNITTWNTSQVTNFTRMFSSARVFNQDISNWDVSNALYMGGMFDIALVFNQPIGNWDIAKVTSTQDMFKNAWEFNQDLSSWNVSNVQSMNGMFFVAKAFNQDLSGWNVAHIPDEPINFANLAAAWTLPRPIWGTVGTPKV